MHTEQGIGKSRATPMNMRVAQMPEDNGVGEKTSEVAEGPCAGTTEGLSRASPTLAGDKASLPSTHKTETKEGEVEKPSVKPPGLVFAGESEFERKAVGVEMTGGPPAQLHPLE